MTKKAMKANEKRMRVMQKEVMKLLNFCRCQFRSMAIHESSDIQGVWDYILLHVEAFNPRNGMTETVDMKFHFYWDGTLNTDPIIDHANINTEAGW